jgi:NAD(P)-dependent dehydrogenase (short-subunit alcohol dehydrogenase family)
MPDQTDPPKVIIILGAYGGIGSALARRLVASGARLVLAGRDIAKLQPLADELSALAVVTDATSFESVDACFAKAKQWAAEFSGRIDGAANCVGSIILKPAHQTTFAEWTETVSLNLTSAFAVVRAAAAAMRPAGGSIVLFGSAAGEVGMPNHEAVAAVKAGVAGLVRSAASTYASAGIRVNGVAPGLVDTPLAARITSNEISLRASIAMHPLGRIGTADNVAAAAQWLLQSDSSWVTGQMLGVDGGLANLKTRPKA